MSSLPDPSGHGVDREVPQPEVRFDAPAERREVDCAAVGDDDTPGAVARGQRKRRPRSHHRERTRSCPGVIARHVDVEDGPAGEFVAQHAADEPGFVDLERVGDERDEIGRVGHRSSTTRSARSGSVRTPHVIS